MAESVTYADLRFVKAPMKKRISSQLGQGPEADDDGELTYENVQVPPLSGGASSLSSSGQGDKTGLPSKQPTAFWSSVTSPAARRLLGCRSACSKYLLGLLLTCLLLGVAAISLGVRYLQVSQQLQGTARVLEVTNSSLRQQLHQKITQLEGTEQDLQGVRRELAQSQEALQAEQRDGGAVKEQFQTCQSEREETKTALQREQEQKRMLEERLKSVRDTLRSYLTVNPPGACCPVGWIRTDTDEYCIYISPIKRSWEESKKFCESLSSRLGYHYHSFLSKLSGDVYLPDSYWVDYKWKDWQGNDGKRASGSNAQNKCPKIQYKVSWIRYLECTEHLPCICEREVFRCPDQVLN